MIDDGECPFCKERTNSLAGNPGKWPLTFTLPDGTGKTHKFHTECVCERLYRRTSEHDKEMDNLSGKKTIFERIRVVDVCKMPRKFRETLKGYVESNNSFINWTINGATDLSDDEKAIDTWLIQNGCKAPFPTLDWEGEKVLILYSW